MRYHLTPVYNGYHQKDKHWQWCGEKGTLSTIAGIVSWCNIYGKHY